MGSEIDTRSARFEELEIDVAIELDRREIPFEELSNLTTGAVVEFSNKPIESVKLYANGKYFADATLIKIGEATAVRIEKLIR